MNVICGSPEMCHALSLHIYILKPNIFLIRHLFEISIT